MSRARTSPTEAIVKYFMTVPIDAAKQALQTAKTIIATREAQGLVQPALPAARRGASPTRRPRAVAPGVSSAPSTATAGPGQPVPLIPPHGGGLATGAAGATSATPRRRRAVGWEARAYLAP